MRSRAQKIIGQMDELGVDPFECAYHAGCTALQIRTLQMAARGMTDDEIAHERGVMRISVTKTRLAACRRIVKYLDEKVA